MSMHSYFKKDTKSESNANFQIAHTQVNLTSIRETEICVEMEKVVGKQQPSAAKLLVFKKSSPPVLLKINSYHTDLEFVLKR